VDEDAAETYLEVREGPAHVDFVLRPLPCYRGRLLDHEGRPVAGAVAVAHDDPPMGEIVALDRELVVVGEILFEVGVDPHADLTDAEGRFRLYRRWPEYQYRHRLRVLLPDGRSIDLGSVHYEPPGSEVEHRHQLPKAPPRPVVVLTGRVIDQDGRGVAGAALHFGETRAFAGPDGAFRLVADPGPDVLTFAGQGFPPGVREGLGELPVGEHDLGNLRLDARGGVSVRGLVRDARGAPLEGAVVSATWLLPGGERFLSSASTDRDGYYRLAGPLASPCDVKLEAAHSDCFSEHSKVEGATDARVDFQLSPQAVVTGRIDFTGVVPREVILEPCQDGSDVWMTKKWDPVTRRWRGVLPAGKYDLWISAPGYAPQLVGWFEAVAGKTVTAPRARLTRGGIVEGTVLDRQGRGHRGCPISIRHRRHRVLQRETEEGGRFRIECVPPGRYPITTRVGGETIRSEVDVIDGQTTTVELRPE
jgi:hypothetical protein